MSDATRTEHHYDTSLTSEYIAAVKREANVVHDFRPCDEDSSSARESSLAKKILCEGPDGSQYHKPKAFVIRNVLTPTECDELIQTTEAFGIKDRPGYVARTAKRTKDYTNAKLSAKVETRIKDILEKMFDPSLQEPLDSNGQENQDANADARAKHSSPYMGPFYGIHTNWRILRYDPDSGDAFPAHQDQMDSFQKPRPDGSGRKDLVVSSHTLLIQLSPNHLEGGATRFYPHGKVRLPAGLKTNPSDLASFRNRQFDHAVDVVLPQGWALVFEQRGLLHAGQPLAPSSPCPKHVAQAGVLRVLPEGILQKPAVFKNGPGVTKGAF